jgi:hypothetical protein
VLGSVSLEKEQLMSTTRKMQTVSVLCGVLLMAVMLIAGFSGTGWAQDNDLRAANVPTPKVIGPLPSTISPARNYTTEDLAKYGYVEE